MSPYLQAAAVYEQEPCARTFEHDLFLHFLHGTVWSTTDGFVMLRPVRRDWPLAWLHDPARTDPAGDAWWIWLLAGNPSRLWSLHPPKPWIGFERKNVPRFYPFHRLSRLYRPALFRNRPGTPL
ncbi:MAG TPA: hypothetical protein VG796_19785 [Verrucomicrobiales bacterium]|nr:hypothetical protein [Verrucomicrobiales bacterium]